MLTKKGIEKIENGELDKSFLHGKLKIIIKTYKKKWYQKKRNRLTLEYQLLDLDNNGVLSTEFFEFGFKIGDSLEIELPEIKNKIFIENKY